MPSGEIRNFSDLGAWHRVGRFSRRPEVDLRRAGRAELLSDCPGRDLRASAEAEHVEDVQDVRLRRPRGDEELLRDLAVRQSFCH